MKPIKIFLLLCSIFLFINASEASEDFYTIQTGTYTPSAIGIGYAKRIFDRFSRVLSEDERQYLRIEKGEKYIIVRVGKFDDVSDAGKLLEKVKALIPDAFMLKADNFENIKIIKLYGKNSRPSQKKDSAKETSIKKETSIDKNEASGPSTVLREYYTLQIGNFLTLDEAKKEFDELTRKLKGNDLNDLRIERAGRYFSFRLGKFETYSAVKDFLARMGNQLPETVVMIGKIEDEQIISAYNKTPAQRNIQVEDLKASGEKTVQIKSAPKADAEKQKGDIEVLLKNVTDQYSSEQYGKVAEMLKEGISKWPDNADLYAWYGAALLNMKSPEDALAQYRKAVEKSPNMPNYHAGVGVSLLNIYMDRAKESIDAFKKALELDPNNVSALEGLGFVYASIGKKELAVEMYNRLLTLDKDAANRLYQVMTLGVNWEGK